MSPKSSISPAPRSYQDFLASKALVAPTVGRDVPPELLHPSLFRFQADITGWGIRKGRAAFFEAPGLGKTFQQLEWARMILDGIKDSPGAPRCLIVAPLAVAEQTVAEGERWGIPVAYRRMPNDLPARGIVVTTYDLSDRFDPVLFGAVVLDESSRIKADDSKTRARLIAQWRKTPYRLCCSATPAPNDHAELANHAEFLGVMSRVEMLASFFVHDKQGWRLKGHAQDAFYRWLSSWAMALNKPSDLGYPDDGYALPPLEIIPEIVPTDWTPPGQLFPTTLKGITERAAVRRDTVDRRVERTAELVAAEPDEQWLIWCGLNDEGRLLGQSIPGAVVIEGSDAPDVKAAALLDFAAGKIRVLVSKVLIAGFGMNFQSCARMAFVGLGDSWEQYFQAIRRCWRFGQTRAVRVHIVLTTPEEPIYFNVLRKEKEATHMTDALVKHAADFELAELGSVQTGDTYAESVASGENWTLHLGDSAVVLPRLDGESIDLSVFSPPFESLYTYSASPHDLGNSRNPEEFWEQFGFISRELLRLTKPGRNACVHVAQIPSMLVRGEVIGLKDFRGDTIRHFQSQGWIYHGEICLDKDAQAQSIRTRAKGLGFKQLESDASWMRQALADYILIFRKPGENAVPIKPDVTRDEWIEWARPVWYNVSLRTLSAVAAREHKDERHIAPLQLDTIERCIRLWSNRGETILDPFSGIGSTAYQAVLLGRRGVGVELKRSYWEQAVRNVRDAERQSHEPNLLDAIAAASE